MTPDGRPESYREAIWMGARDGLKGLPVRSAAIIMLFIVLIQAKPTICDRWLHRAWIAWPFK